MTRGKLGEEEIEVKVVQKLGGGGVIMKRRNCILCTRKGVMCALLAIQLTCVNHRAASFIVGLS